MAKQPIPSGQILPVDGFLKAILRSGLIDREGLQTALRPVPRELRDNPEAIADHLIRLGRLTRFQARKLLRGASLGLVLSYFQVLAPIARGGMGTVYLARDVRSELLLALKILPPRRAREEDRLLRRFRREMEMCQRVSHPHLAWTYEAGVHRGVYYIAMEYIPGRSLYRLVVDEGMLPVARTARLFAEVALALDHAHNQGLIHRDLKPSNIMVTPNDHAKVLDLGLALMEGEARTGEREIIGGQGYVLGTMDYIAPEQTDDPTKVDPRCDIYALGCSLYYTLTGRPPFPGGTSKEKILRQRTEEPVPIPELNPSVPAGFVDLVRRMMAKSPDLRVPTAAVLRHELLRWAEKGPARPLDRPEDSGYRQAVTLLIDREPSAEAVSETLPAPEAPPPAPTETAPQDAVTPPMTTPQAPKRSPRPGITVPKVILEEPDSEPESDSRELPSVPIWRRYLIPVVVGLVVGVASLVTLILFLRR